MNEWEWQLLEDKTPLDYVEIHRIRVKPGDRVRLRPRAGSDVLDLALAGKTATVESLEQDYEGGIHVCLVVDDDPGRDIGLMRQPGHRFFFSPSEIETLEPTEAGNNGGVAPKRILIAGIGNIFLGDDGFGVEVAQRLAKNAFPPGVKVVDFGIRGFDLAYALMEGYETTILVDAYPSEMSPGTVSVVEPDLSELRSAENNAGLVEPHAMNPLNVLRMAAKMGVELKRILLVGCVPTTLGPNEGQMGLSERVAGAVDEAVGVVHSLVERILRGEWPGTRSSSSDSDFNSNGG